MQMQFLGRDQRKTLRQVKTHLVTEHRPGASAGAIRFLATLFENMSHQLKILLHYQRSFSPAPAEQGQL